MGDQPGTILQVVEGYDHVVQPDRQRRNLELIDAWGRQPLQAPVQVVGEQSGNSTLKRRQIRAMPSLPRQQPAPQGVQAANIVGRQSDELDGIGGDKRIATQLSFAQRTVQKDAVGQAG